MSFVAPPKTPLDTPSLSIPPENGVKIATAMDMLNVSRQQCLVRRSFSCNIANQQDNLQRKDFKDFQKNIKQAGYPYMRILLWNRSSESHEGSLSSDLPSKKDPLELNLGITEISGEAGCGKTQICLGLCVSCAMSVPINPVRSKLVLRNPYVKVKKQKTCPTFREGSSYDSTTFHFSALYLSLGDEGGTKTQLSHRLNQIINSRVSDISASDYPNTSSLTSDILSRIWIRHIRNIDEFRDFINVELNGMLNSNVGNEKNNEKELETKVMESKIGLIVLDSMSGLFRRWEDNHSQIDRPNVKQKTNFANHNKYSIRSGEFFRTSSRLKWLSENYNVPIVVVNQMTSKLENLQPALGLSWSYCINTRFLLTRNEIPEIEGNEMENDKKYDTSSKKRDGSSRFDRRIRLEFASHLTLNPSNDLLHNGIEFTIESCGPTSLS